MGTFIADTQEMIDVCLNCRRVTCTGNCTDIQMALHTPVRGKRRKYTLTADGAPVSVAELAARCDVSIGTIEYRVKQGWTGDRILAHYGGQDG